MGNRRTTGLTNAFSKKAANHAHTMAIYVVHDNFAGIRQPLKITPAMASGVTSKLWEMSNMVAVLEDWEAKRSNRPSTEACIALTRFVSSSQRGDMVGEFLPRHRV